MDALPFAKRFGLSQARSCFELQEDPDVWMRRVNRLIESWNENHKDPTNATEHKPESPFRKRNLPVARIIKTLRTGLPFIRTDALQRTLSNLFDLIAASCSSEEFYHLDTIINHQRVVIDTIANQLRRGMSRDQILQIEYGDWKREHIKLALIDPRTGDFRSHAFNLSRRLTRKWACLEPLDAPLRQESPLKWLISFWVVRELDTSNCERVESILQEIMKISGDLLLFLRYQSQQFVRLGFEHSDSSGSCILHFIYFNCCLPSIIPKALQLRLLSDFVKLRLTLLRSYEKTRLHLSSTI
jgi:hypothetical protein